MGSMGGPLAVMPNNYEGGPRAKTTKEGEVRPSQLQNKNSSFNMQPIQMDQRQDVGTFPQIPSQ